MNQLRSHKIFHESQVDISVISVPHGIYDFLGREFAVIVGLHRTCVDCVFASDLDAATLFGCKLQLTSLRQFLLSHLDLV